MWWEGMGCLHASFSFLFFCFNLIQLSPYYLLLGVLRSLSFSLFRINSLICCKDILLRFFVGGTGLRGVADMSVVAVGGGHHLYCRRLYGP